MTTITTGESLGQTSGFIAPRSSMKHSPATLSPTAQRAACQVENNIVSEPKTLPNPHLMINQISHSQTCLAKEIAVLRGILLDQISISPQLRQMASSCAVRSVLESHQKISCAHFATFQRECGDLEIHRTGSNGLQDDVVQNATRAVREQLLDLSHSQSRDMAILIALEKISGHAISSCEVAFVYACAARDERLLRLVSQTRHDEIAFKQQWRLLMHQIESDAAYTPEMPPLYAA